MGYPFCFRRPAFERPVVPFAPLPLRGWNTKTSSVVEAFGESEPVATIPGPKQHTLVLTRLYATQEAAREGMNFHDLEDFNLVICKPDRRVIYSGCQWESLSETGKLGDMVLEKVTIVAARRGETALT